MSRVLLVLTYAVLVRTSVGRAQEVEQEAPPSHGPILEFELRPAEGILHDLVWVGDTAVLDLAADGQPTDGGGLGLVLDYEAPFDTTLYVSVMAADGDAYLQVRDLDGRVLAEDDDSGSGPRGRDAFLRLEEVGGGEPLELVISVRDTDQVLLKVFEVQETPASRALSVHLGECAKEVRAAVSDGDLERARGAIRDVAGAVRNTEGAVRSQLVATACEELVALAAGVHATAARALLESCARAFDEYSLPAGHPNLGVSRVNLGAQLMELGEFETSRALLDAAIRGWEPSLSEDDANLAIARVNLAGVLSRQGRGEEARPLFEQVLETDRRASLPLIPHVLLAKNGLATVLREQGNPAGRTMLEELLVEVQDLLPPLHPYLLGIQQNLALVMKDAGEYSRARELEERILAARAQELPPEDLELQAIRQNLAATMARQGDVQGARSLLAQVLGALERLPEETLELQRARFNTATLLEQGGELQRARSLMEKVVARLAADLPKHHPELLSTRIGLGRVLVEQGDLPRARDVFEEVLEIQSEVLSTDHPDLQLSRIALAVTLKALGDVEGAHALEELALLACVENLYRGHPFLFAVRLNLAQTAVLAGDLELCRGNTRELAQDLFVGSGHGESVLSRRQWDEWVNSRENFESWVLSLCGVEHKCLSGSDQFRMVESLRARSTVKARLQRQVEIPATVEQELAEVDDALHRTSAQLRRSLYRMPGTAADGAESFSALVLRKESLESRRSALLGPWIEAQGLRFEPDAGAVAECLPEGTAAIGFWRYDRIRIDLEARTVGAGENAYLAFVLRRGAPVQRIDLATDHEVRAALHSWFDAIDARSFRGGDLTSPARFSEPEAGERLRSLVFDPLRSALADCTHLVVAPDGLLHLIPLGALPAPGAKSEGVTLSDQFAFEFRTTLKELTATHRSELNPPRLLAVGNIEFGEPVEVDDGETEWPKAAPRETAGSWQDVEVAATDRSHTLRTRKNRARLFFEPLPESAVEVRRIAELFDQNFGGGGSGSRILDGREATRDRFLIMAPHARFLHVATHSYIEEEIIPTTIDVRLQPNDFGSAFQDRRTQVVGMSPMSVTGIALSRANVEDPEVGGQIGLVTADEIADLDLSGCELVVFSSCGSGVGLERAGQGMASLQQAVQVAGARMSLTSVYDVPDHSTRELMSRFYDRWWRRGMSPRAALSDAQRSMRQEKDSHGRPMYGTRDWAAWVIVGPEW